MEEDDKWKICSEERAPYCKVVLGYDAQYGDILICSRTEANSNRVMPLYDNVDDCNIVLWRELPMPSFEKIKKARRLTVNGIAYDQRAA